MASPFEKNPEHPYRQGDIAASPSLNCLRNALLCLTFKSEVELSVQST